MTNIKAMFQILLHPPGEYISDHIRNKGGWEKITCEVLIEVFKHLKLPSVTFVDVGANIGYISLLVANLGYQVLAFEPIPTNFSLLKQSITLNNFNHMIKVYQKGVLDFNGKINMNISSFNMGLCSMRDLGSDTTSTLVVDVVSLDSIINIVSPLVVKIDVEEKELEVLRGMTRLLRCNQVVVMIIEVSTYQKELFNVLRENGYTRVVNIGHSYPESSEIINIDTSYLQNEKYWGNLDVIEQEQKSNPKQLMLLICKEEVEIEMKKIASR